MIVLLMTGFHWIHPLGLSRPPPKLCNSWPIFLFFMPHHLLLPVFSLMRMQQFSFTETLSLECLLNEKPTQHFLLFFEKSHPKFLMTFPKKEKQMHPQNSRFPICDTTQRKPHVKIPFFLFINFFPIAHCSAYECYVYSQLSKLMEASCGRDN